MKKTELVKLTTYEKGFELEQTVNEANKQGVRIPSSKEMSSRLVHSDVWKTEREMYICRTGTFMAYEKWDKPLGEKIEWEGFIVLVPKQFQGKKNIALVCNHPDFKLENKVFSSDKFKAIELPHEDGWYDTETEFELPTGEKKKYAENRRYNCRYQNEKYIGLVLRWDGGDDGDRRGVGCDGRPDGRCGVFGIKGNGKMPKPPAHKHEWTCECGAVRSK